MKLRGDVLSPRAITGRQKDAMFALMERHYENVTREGFEADLQEKYWVILLRDENSDKIRGFSTQILLEAAIVGKPVSALFSGDTIIAREHWGDIALSHVWGNLALSLIDLLAGRELYWFLITKGYRTYRFLPLFFGEFYPRCNTPTPRRIRQVIDALGTQKFGRAYDPAAGVVRTHCGKDHLRAGIADITPTRLRDPHVRFFVQRNPSHAQGEELCCLAPLTRANFTPAAWRVINAEAGAQRSSA